MSSYRCDLVLLFIKRSQNSLLTLPRCGKYKKLRYNFFCKIWINRRSVYQKIYSTVVWYSFFEPWPAWRALSNKVFLLTCTSWNIFGVDYKGVTNICCAGLFCRKAYSSLKVKRMTSSFDKELLKNKDNFNVSDIFNDSSGKSTTLKNLNMPYVCFIIFHLKLFY